MDKTFLLIFEKFKDDILRLAYSYTKNITDAEDITQSVFVKLYKNKNILMRQDIEIKKWLVCVTINECKSLINSFWRKKIFLLKQEDEDNIISKQKEDDTLSEILLLPQKYRLVIYLYYYENYRIKEISKILKLTETNVQTILSRARSMLREQLKGEWVYE